MCLEDTLRDRSVGTRLFPVVKNFNFPFFSRIQKHFYFGKRY
jgi:hypothetical protein